MRSWLIACVLAATSAAAARAASGPPPAVMTALLQLYGRYDPAAHCWHATAQAGGSTVPACLAIVQSDEVAAPEGPRTYMVLQGRAAQGCHGCGGAVAFIVFGGANGLRVLAHSPALPDGNDSSPTGPQRIALNQLGAAQWGWIEAASGAEPSFVVWLPRAGRVVPVARLPPARSDASECDRGRCAVTLSYRIDTSDPQAAYYPILLQASGRDGRHRLAGQAVAHFDLPQYTYRYTYRLSPGLP